MPLSQPSLTNTKKLALYTCVVFVDKLPRSSVVETTSRQRHENVASVRISDEQHLDLKEKRRRASIAVFVGLLHILPPLPGPYSWKVGRCGRDFRRHASRRGLHQPPLDNFVFFNSAAAADADVDIIGHRRKLWRWRWWWASLPWSW